MATELQLQILDNCLMTTYKSRTIDDKTRSMQRFDCCGCGDCLMKALKYMKCDSAADTESRVEKIGRETCCGEILGAFYASKTKFEIDNSRCRVIRLPDDCYIIQVGEGLIQGLPLTMVELAAPVVPAWAQADFEIFTDNSCSCPKECTVMKTVVKDVKRENLIGLMLKVVLGWPSAEDLNCPGISIMADNTDKFEGETLQYNLEFYRLVPRKEINVAKTVANDRLWNTLSSANSGKINHVNFPAYEFNVERNADDLRNIRVTVNSKACNVVKKMILLQHLYAALLSFGDGNISEETPCFHVDWAEIRLEDCGMLDIWVYNEDYTVDVLNDLKSRVTNPDCVKYTCLDNNIVLPDLI